jgi:asparagine synthase (glutamine-hydrolysing)
MCGICGELRFDHRRADLSAIGRMLSTLAPRGPDHEGSFSDGPLALGHRRLAVIDLSDRSNQPLVDHQHGLVLVFNGTIFNYPELRQELIRAGHGFFSRGDSEVVLKGFAAWGPQVVERLHGVFALAIWDRSRRTLFLARDRLGIKPLYFTANRDRFRFASSTQALLAAGGVDVEIDSVALHHQLTLHGVVPAPRTILNGVRKLEPGTTVTIDGRGQRSVVRYWQLEARCHDLRMEDEQWVERVREQLAAAIRRRNSVADVPVGVLLSGGLDSSLLLALLAQSGVRHVKTFSVGFEDQPEERGSEFEFSDLMVERYNTDHYQFQVANDEILARLPEAVACMSEPMVGQDAIAFYLLAELVSREVKVVQSGQGADEVFAGYFWYAQMQNAQGSDLDRFAGHYFDRDHDDYLRAITNRHQGGDYTSEKISYLLSLPGADLFLDKVLRMDVTTLVVDDPVKRVDNMTMHWGLEARMPYLDHQLVELAMCLPVRLKLMDGGKGVLRRIARDLVPDVIVDRTKGYFPVPALKYVRGKFLEFMGDVLSSRVSRERGLFRPEHLQRLLANPEAHMTRLQGSKLWHAALLEVWLQVNVDAQAASRPAPTSD